jgi:hypothetical protein
MKKVFALYFTCLSLVVAFGQKNRHQIYFKTNESTLNSKQTKELDSLVLSVTKNPAAKLLIIGHTDSIGAFESNRKLSLNRASSIESYFLEKGIETKRIQKEYYGYLFPIASNKKEADRAKNRRTEIIVYTEKELATLDKAKKTQTFTFKDNSKDLKITTKGGAKIRIPAKTLVTKNKRTGVENIRIEITEAYSLSDMIDNNLHTLSDEGILETDGMIKIKAFDKSGEICLKKDSVFYMALPTKNKQKDMDLYTMNSDTSKHWTTKELRNMANFKYVMDFYYTVNDGSTDTMQTNRQLRRAFGYNFLDSLTTKANYFTKAEKLNYNYNIDKLKLLYGDLGYEKINVLNLDTVNLSYRLILKDIKALYFQIFSADKSFSIDKIKGKNSYLIAFKYDILKNIVQYDIIDISNTNEITLKLKTVSAEQYKDNVNKLWN